MLFTIDFGTGSGVLYDGTQDVCTKYSRKELLQAVLTLPPGSIVVGEDAHFGRPQKDLSRAQPYTATELLTWYQECTNKGVQLKLFSQQMTARAKNYSVCTEKTDENDARAIYKLITDFPQITMKNPPVHFDTDKKRQEIYKFKSETNAILNVGRGREDKYDDETDAIVMFIRKHLKTVADQLSLEEQTMFGLDKRYKRGNGSHQAGDINFNQVKMTILYSIVATLIDYNGNLRKRPSTNELIGWKFVKRHIFGFGPFHLKGGVARSNIVFHGMRHWIGGQMKQQFGQKKMCGRGGYFKDEDKTNYIDPFTTAEDLLFINCRKKYTIAIQKVFNIFRSE